MSEIATILKSALKTARQGPVLSEADFQFRILSMLVFFMIGNITSLKFCLFEFDSLTFHSIMNTEIFLLLLLLLLLALQPPLGVVFYSPLVGFSLLACEVS